MVTSLGGWGLPGGEAETPSQPEQGQPHSHLLCFGVCEIQIKWLSEKLGEAARTPVAVGSPARAVGWAEEALITSVPWAQRSQSPQPRSSSPLPADGPPASGSALFLEPVSIKPVAGRLGRALCLCKAPGSEAWRTPNPSSPCGPGTSLSPGNPSDCLRRPCGQGTELQPGDSPREGQK